MVTAAAPGFPDSPALPQSVVATTSSSSSSPASFQNVYQSLPAQPGDSGSALPNSKATATKRSSSKCADDQLPAILSAAITADSPSQLPWAPALPSFRLTAAGRDSAQPSLSGQEAPIRDAAAGIAPSVRQLAAIREPALDSEIPAGAPPLSSRTSETKPSHQPGVDPSLFSKGLAAALAPRSENLAFSIKMLESNSAARHAQQAGQPEPRVRNQAGTESKSEEHTPEPSLASGATHAKSSPANIPGEVAAAAAAVSPVWNEAAATPHLDVRPDTSFSEPHQPDNISTVAALHDAQPILPEAARPNAAAEIMLQLGGKDQTSAAIRVTDRAGTVNVSVHASDADLRSSLRSNLGELASQLSHQGWKTEVVKTGTTLTRGDTPQDSRQDGRSPGQQHSFAQGERQSQRDRRAASGHWLAEFEEQASSNSGNPGGTN